MTAKTAGEFKRNSKTLLSNSHQRHGSKCLVFEEFFSVLSSLFLLFVIGGNPELKILKSICKQKGLHGDQTQEASHYHYHYQSSLFTYSRNSKLTLTGFHSLVVIINLNVGWETDAKILCILNGKGPAFEIQNSCVDTKAKVLLDDYQWPFQDTFHWLLSSQLWPTASVQRALGRKMQCCKYRSDVFEIYMKYDQSGNTLMQPGSCECEKLFLAVGTYFNPRVTIPPFVPKASVFTMIENNTEW